MYYEGVAVLFKHKVDEDKYHDSRKGEPTCVKSVSGTWQSIRNIHLLGARPPRKILV